MDIVLIAAVGTAAFVSGAQVLQIFLTKRIEALVLQGSKFHLAMAPSGVVELRSGSRRGSMTQKEATALAPALRTLSSRVRWNPLLGLRLLSNSQQQLEQKSIEDSFLQAAVESQRQELIMLAEERGIMGNVVPLIMGLEYDGDFSKIREALGAAEFGAELPEGLTQGLQLRDHRAVEPLVLWSSKPSPRAAALSASSGDPAVPAGIQGEIPSLPGCTLRTELVNHGTTYEKVVVQILRDGRVIASDDAYTSVAGDRIEAEIESMKRGLIRKVRSLESIGL